MKPNFFKANLHVLVGWGISAGFLLWLYATTEWGVVRQELLNSNYMMLLPLTLILVVHFGLRGLRWRYLLPPPTGEAPSYPILVNSLMLGNFATIILPLRAGEFVRPYALSLRSTYSFVVGFVSVVIERIFDLAVVLFAFALMVQSVPGVPDIAYKGAYALSILAVGMIVATGIAAFKPALIESIASKVVLLLPHAIRDKVSVLVGKLLHGATPLRSPANLLKTVSLSLVIWATSFMYYQLGLQMMGIHGSIWMSIAVGVMIALAVAAPSAPGFIGVFQAGTIAGLGMFAVSKESATAYSIVVHLHQILFIAVWGMGVLMTGQIKFAALQRARLENVN